MTTVLVGGEHGLVALQEQPYGWEVWERGDPEWAGRRVHDLIQDASRTILAATDAGLWASGDTGVSWRALLSGNISVVRAAPGGATALFAGTEPGVAWRSRDAGQRWERLDALESSAERAHWRGAGSALTTTPPASRVTDFAFPYATVDLLFAAVEIGGIYRSRDDGASWGACHDQLPTTAIHRLTAHPRESSVLLAATDFGIYLTANQGDAWGLLDLDAGAGYTRALTILEPGTLGEPPTILAGVCEVDPAGWEAGPDGARCRLHRSTDGGATWQVMTAGLPPLFPAPISALARDADDFDKVCLGTGDGRVYLSRDRATTWIQVAEELGPISTLLLLRE